MTFDGPALSFDDEGSILFDGEKIIVTVPVGHEALDHLGSEEEIPFPVVYTHSSHHQDQQASTPPPPSGGNQPSQPSHNHGDRTGSQSGGQGSSSDSGKKDGADSLRLKIQPTPIAEKMKQVRRKCHRILRRRKRTELIQPT